MKHTVSKQQLLLFVSGELPEGDAVRIDRHLKRCAACRKEVSDIRNLHSFVQAHVPAPDERTLTAWRRDVVRTIRTEEPRRSVVAVVREFFGFAEGPVLRPALALLAVGCLAYVLGFSTAGTGEQDNALFAPIAYDPYGAPAGDASTLTDAQVVNVDILSRDEVTGEISFDFEATFRSHVEGNMSDPSIQGILARALVSSQNPGVRLRAVNAFSGSLPENGMADRTRDVIKRSLVSAVKYDENQGVRLEALRALKDFMPDSVATAAIVHVLLHDETAAMKIAAINSLDLRRFPDTNERDMLSAILKDRSLNDENNYIRIKAKAALQEVVQ